MVKISAYLFCISLILLLLFSCNDDTPALRVCDRIVGEVCPNNTNAEYCLIGIKWGNGSEFENTGADANGPGLASGIITYSFQTEITTLRMHNNDELQTISIDDKGDCVREKVEEALAEYESIAQVQFAGQADNSDSDIEFYASIYESLNVAYCNFQGSPCDELHGRVIFSQSNVSNRCNQFYQTALHEIGHALGLGHVTTPNIMNVDSQQFDFEKLQDGDIAGIRSIYGQ